MRRASDCRLFKDVGLANPRQPFFRSIHLAAAIAAALLSGCNGVLDPRGPVGYSARLILFDSLAIMIAVVTPVLVAIAIFAWWFRASNRRAFYWPNWEFSGHLELLVWSIPALVVVFLGGIAWFGSQTLDPFRPLDEQAKAYRGPGRLARLEVAVPLPRRGRGERQRSGGSRRRTGAFPADVERRHEQLLRAPARQPDLFDGGDDLAAASAGRRARDFPRHLGQFQRRRLLRHAFRRALHAARRLREMGRRREVVRRRARPGRICRAPETEPERQPDHLPLVRAGTVRGHRERDRAAIAGVELYGARGRGQAGDDAGGG